MLHASHRAAEGEDKGAGKIKYIRKRPHGDVASDRAMGQHIFPQRAQVFPRCTAPYAYPNIPRVPWRDAGTTEMSGLKNIQCLMPVKTSGSHDEIHLCGG